LLSVGQVYQYSGGYFEVLAMSGGFVRIHYVEENIFSMVLKNAFPSQIEEGAIRLVDDKIELAKVLLSF
jgi:hypothetical protein